VSVLVPVSVVVSGQLSVGAESMRRRSSGVAGVQELQNGTGGKTGTQIR
jgi:hypothetical protein